MWACADGEPVVTIADEEGDDQITRADVVALLTLLYTASLPAGDQSPWGAR